MRARFMSFLLSFELFTVGLLTVLQGLVLAQPVHAVDAATAAKYAKYNYRANGQLRGHCTRVASIGSPLPEACKGAWLALRSEDGKELQRVQTNEQGDFSFPAQNGVKYLVVSGTPESTVVTSPTRPIHGGQQINLTLDSK